MNQQHEFFSIEYQNKTTLHLFDYKQQNRESLCGIISESSSPVMLNHLNSLFPVNPWSSTKMKWKKRSRINGLYLRRYGGGWKVERERNSSKHSEEYPGRKYSHHLHPKHFSWEFRSFLLLMCDEGCLRSTDAWCGEKGNNRRLTRSSGERDEFSLFPTSFLRENWKVSKSHAPVCSKTNLGMFWVERGKGMNIQHHNLGFSEPKNILCALFFRARTSLP